MVTHDHAEVGWDIHTDTFIAECECGWHSTPQATADEAREMWFQHSWESQ